MKIAEKISRKFYNKKGITGTDVAAAIMIIFVTIGVITGIYINIMNASKQNIRYSAATRIATQIVENIESMGYDEVISQSVLQIDSKTGDDIDRKIFNVAIPMGYSVDVTISNISSEVDVIKKINVEVSYKAGKSAIDYINLQVVKERELLEQTNVPDMSLLPETSLKYFYPIKLTSKGYVVTTISDKDWYNYDIGCYANVYVSNMEKEIGDIVAPNTGERYVWIPRFGKIEDAQLDKNNISFLYGTSKHRIVFKNIDSTQNFYSYTLDYSKGKYNDTGVYVENTFKDNDGLSGMWYILPDDYNSANVEDGDEVLEITKEETAFKALNTIFPIKN